jgi:hypothetical protein
LVLVAILELLTHVVSARHFERSRRRRKDRSGWDRSGGCFWFLEAAEVEGIRALPWIVEVRNLDPINARRFLSYRTVVHGIIRATVKYLLSAKALRSRRSD